MGTTTKPWAAEFERALKAIRYIRENDCDFLTVENVADYAQLHPVSDDGPIRAALCVEMGAEWYARLVEYDVANRSWDHIDGQTVAVPTPAIGQRPQVYAVVPGRRWTRVHEYLTNGQLTARFFVDQVTGEARQADGARKPKRWPMDAAAQQYARTIVQLARERAERATA